MLPFPNIDPVALDLGPLKIHWYGLMYLVGFAAAWWLGVRRARQPNSGWNADQVSDLIFYGALGVVLGGRIGYTLFYSLGKFISDPLMIFRVWEGGMSFHGGFLGVILAMAFFARKHKMAYLDLTDFIAPLTPIALGAGRFGNFINGELWGKVTDVPWAMVFPTGGPSPRHPSQLYEFFLEGVVLFVIVWFFTTRPRPRMAAAGVFTLGYGCFRFFIEFFRQPDAHIGYLAFGWFTMGQLLSVPMIILGLVCLWLAYTKFNTGSSATPKTQTTPATTHNKAET